MNGILFRTEIHCTYAVVERKKHLIANPGRDGMYSFKTSQMSLAGLLGKQRAGRISAGGGRRTLTGARSSSTLCGARAILLRAYLDNFLIGSHFNR